MKHLTILTLALVICISSLNAQTKSKQKSPVLTEVSPESVGISSERLARMDKMCEQTVKDGDVPGIVTLVVRNGKIVQWKAYGMANNQAGKKLERDAIFIISS